MANYNIELKKRNTANTGWDSLYPITQAANVVMQDGKAVEQKVSEHLADDATTAQKGHVQLNDAVNSTSTTTAATANAVKKAYDRAEQAFTQVGDGKTKIATAITDMGQSALGSDTFDVLASKVRNISKDATAVAGDLLAGKTAYVNGNKVSGQLAKNSYSTNAVSYRTSGTSIAVAIPFGAYKEPHASSGYPEVVISDVDLVEGNIKQGVNLFGKVGTLIPGASIKSIQTGEVSCGTSNTVTISSVDVSKSIILFTGRNHISTGSSDLEMNTTVEFVSSTSIKFSRYNSYSNMYIGWCVIEFNNANVQHFSGLTPYTIEYENLTMSPVNVNKSIAIVYSRNKDGGASSNHGPSIWACMPTIVNSTTLRLTRNKSGGASSYQGYYTAFVIEFP